MRALAEILMSAQHCCHSLGAAGPTVVEGKEEEDIDTSVAGKIEEDRSSRV